MGELGVETSGGSHVSTFPTQRLGTLGKCLYKLETNKLSHVAVFAPFRVCVVHSFVYTIRFDTLGGISYTEH